MRISQFFAPTMREVPAEAEALSHKLMLRAGMIRKLAAGVYTYLPMGYRVIRKVEDVVRKCMNEAGAIELFMPSIQPAELWQESGRWQQYGKELLRIKDRHDREFCYGPTHEEVITDIARNMLPSYKQLPINLYQMQTKFRDEVRPRFGLMRGREFIMMDSYSFDQDEEGAQQSYEKMRQAYCRIFEGCGLSYKMVDADSGSIGGSFSHEFMVLAGTGEDAVISCDSCNYAANLEKAVAMKPVSPDTAEESPHEVSTPGAHTVEEVAAFLKVRPEQVIKTIIVRADDKLLAVLVRGDHEANLIKVKNHLKADSVEMATAADIRSTGSPLGFSGPVGLNIHIYADYAILDINSAVVGGNKQDVHIVGTKAGRDYQVSEVGDFRNAMAGDVCPNCGGHYEIARGIEVGHIFKLGTKYSESMQAKFLDRNGRQQNFVMGCYGIGVGRTAASAIEQNNDERGIIWPINIAPFEVVVLPLNTNEADILNFAEEVYTGLTAAGVDVIIDDRDERAGVKLSDADLIGYPVRVTIGKKTFADGLSEVTFRRTGESVLVAKEEIVRFVAEKVKEMREKGE